MPRRRRFRYDTVLRVRKRQEELKAAALGETCRAISAAEQAREEIIQQQIRTLHDAGKAASHRFAAADVHRYYLYERFLARRAVDKDATLAQLRDEEAQRRFELEEAMKRKRIIERLKERQHRALLAEVNKEEQAVTDEAATNHAAIARRRRYAP